MAKAVTINNQQIENAVCGHNSHCGEIKEDVIGRKTCNAVGKWYRPQCDLLIGSPLKVISTEKII